MDVESAQKILKKVQKDYDLIAKEWNESRSFPRPFQASLVKNIKKEDKVLDAGCGNGVLYDVLAPKSIDYTGVDISQKLLRLARQRVKCWQKNHSLNSFPPKADKFVKSSILKMPFPDRAFDWVLALAVLHHIPSRELQTQAVQEIFRVLKSGGRVVATVWNLYSDYAEKKFKIKKQLKNRPNGWGQKDITIPWKATKGKQINRFIYSFAKKDITDLFKRVGFKKITVRYDYNIVLTAQKSRTYTVSSNLITLPKHPSALQ